LRRSGNTRRNCRILSIALRLFEQQKRILFWPGEGRSRSRERGHGIGIKSGAATGLIQRYQFIAAGLVSVDAAMILYVKPGGPSEAWLWRRRKEEAAL
jgi:hypothetical protein